MTATQILLVEDDPSLRSALAATLSMAKYEVHEASDGLAALDVLSTTNVDAVVSDYQMEPMNGSELLDALRKSRPDMPFVLMTAYGTVQHAVESIQQGANDYLVKPFDAPTLLEKIESVIQQTDVARDMIAEDAATLRVVSFAERVAPSDVTVLISGESGSGKEVFARHIHNCSGRGGGPFVAINCAAIPENMLESLLFGHEKGAFTGAHVARAGKFEQAQGGTLLLDEISEIDQGLQAKLLRVLQEKEVERIGARQALALDVRIIATTNRDLPDCVRRGRFREDLYYRLSVFPLHLPPLRSRRADILPLAKYFLSRACAGNRTTPLLSAEATEKLRQYDWPGNVRELQNLMERALILCDGRHIHGRDLVFESSDLNREPPLDRISATENQDESPSDDRSMLRNNLRSIEDQLVLDALEQSQGRRQPAAQSLGVSPRTLRYKIAKLRDAGIEIPGR